MTVPKLLTFGGVLLLILNFTSLWQIGPFGRDTAISLRLQENGVSYQTSLYISACLGWVFWISLTMLISGVVIWPSELK